MGRVPMRSTEGLKGVNENETEGKLSTFLRL